MFGTTELPGLMDSHVIMDPLFYGACVGGLVIFYCSGVLRAIVMLPATSAHELAHLIVAALFVASPSAMSLEPKRVRGGWQHGSVTFRATQLNGAFIALAPLFLLPMLAFGMWSWSQGVNTLWHRMSIGYLIGTLLVGSWPSREDWAIAFRYPSGFLALIGCLIVYHL